MCKVGVPITVCRTLCILMETEIGVHVCTGNYQLLPSPRQERNISKDAWRFPTAFQSCPIVRHFEHFLFLAPRCVSSKISPSQALLPSTPGLKIWELEEVYCHHHHMNFYFSLIILIGSSLHIFSKDAATVKAQIVRNCSIEMGTRISFLSEAKGVEVGRSIYIIQSRKVLLVAEADSTYFWQGDFWSALKTCIFHQHTSKHIQSWLEPKKLYNTFCTFQNDHNLFLMPSVRSRIEIWFLSIILENMIDWRKFMM